MTLAQEATMDPKSIFLKARNWWVGMFSPSQKLMNDASAGLDVTSNKPRLRNGASFKCLVCNLPLQFFEEGEEPIIDENTCTGCYRQKGQRNYHLHSNQQIMNDAIKATEEAKKQGFTTKAKERWERKQNLFEQTSLQEYMSHNSYNERWAREQWNKRNEEQNQIKNWEQKQNQILETEAVMNKPIGELTVEDLFNIMKEMQWNEARVNFKNESNEVYAFMLIAKDENASHIQEFLDGEHNDWLNKKKRTRRKSKSNL